MNPLDELPFPVYCVYPECRGGPFANGIEVDEHITEEHLAESIWTFAAENMVAAHPAPAPGHGGDEDAG